jgi:hypothetical protein
MSSQRPAGNIERLRERIAHVKRGVAAIDYLCSGTLIKRTKLCGNPTCRCAGDPNARHGPYYEWGHMQGGRLVKKMISPKQAAALRLAIANYQRAKKLLRAWEEATARLIEMENPRSE